MSIIKNIVILGLGVWIGINAGSVHNVPHFIEKETGYFIRNDAPSLEAWADHLLSNGVKNVYHS